MRITVDTKTGCENISLTVTERQHLDRAMLVLRSLSRFDDDAADAITALQSIAGKIDADGNYVTGEAKP